MPPLDHATLSDAIRRAFERYDEPLLRNVAGKLFKPRSQWPVEELIERSLATLSNAAVIDRRLQELGPPERRLLALIAHSRQPRWRVGNLVEMLLALGCADGIDPILGLLDSGLLYPVLHDGSHASIKSFQHWLGTGTSAWVFAHPQVSARALGVDLGLPDCPPVEGVAGPVHEADGLEWPLRLAAAWQLFLGAPFRRTQHGQFFKRDQERLLHDPILSAPPAENLLDGANLPLMAIALAQAEGVVREEEGQLRGGELPAWWEEGLASALGSLYAALPIVNVWQDPASSSAPTANPYPSAHFLALLLLGRLPKDGWTSPTTIEDWVQNHHPFWKGTRESKPAPRRAGESRVTAFLLGCAYQLRLLQAAKDSSGEVVVRLSPTGRWLLGMGEAPVPAPPFPQTLLVQPNLEVVAYRQGLTPGLIARLSRFALWKTLGPACTLQLQADMVYHGMESGLSFETIVRTLEQHGMRSTPAGVVESLRTWAGKRERITVYPTAALFEFATTDDLNEALVRGLPATRLADRLAVVASESGVQFRHFRLTGTRDYGLPPEPCINVEADGVTLSVDLARSDLLLESELLRFAQPLDEVAVSGRRRYRLTPASVRTGRQAGLAVTALEAWFPMRTGGPMPPAARLLVTAAEAPAPEIRQRLVLRVTNAACIDGLLQWPETRALIQERLGPTSVAIEASQLETLRDRLRELGVELQIV